MYLHKSIQHWRGLAALLVPLLLAACGTTSLAPSSPEPARPIVQKPSSSNPVLPAARSGKGGYYMDDGPAEVIPDGLLDTPDAVPRIEPYSKAASRPYTVLGATYTPLTDNRPFKQQGIGSWYGKKFHGQKTSSGEIYDMFKMTAAHPTLPIPSYARVTNLENGKQVIVRINDRGPFHSNRIIDLSYTAALKLGYLGKGSGMLQVERILPDEIARMNSGEGSQPAAVANTAAVVPANNVKPVSASMADASAGTAPSTTVATSASPVNIQPTASGFYLQLGAYGQAVNAEMARAKLMETWPATMPSIDIVESGAMHRLQSGPFATRMDADAAAMQLRNAGTAKPMVVQK